jgi:hypothetical protein
VTAPPPPGPPDTALDDEMINARLHVAREAVRDVPRAARDAADERVRRYWWRRIILAAALAAVLASIATAIVTVRVFGAQLAAASALQAARDAGQDAAAEELRVRALAAREQGEAANRELVDRGLEPVDVPVLGTVPDYEVLVSSIVPVLLAELSDPPEPPPPGEPDVLEPVTLAPTAEQVADALTAYLAANPIAVSPQDVADQVAAYLAANPPPEGPAGPAGPAGPEGSAGPVGERGPPPSAEDIMAAFSDAVATNPSLLCPAGGSYGSATVTAPGGGTIEVFGCFGAVQPPGGSGDGGSGDGGGGSGGGGSGDGGSSGSDDPPLVQPPADPDPTDPDPDPAPTQAPTAPPPAPPTDPDPPLLGD